MIPKIAWIHWANPPMPWLRSRSVETFKKHHPDWQVWTIGTPSDIRSYGMSYAHEADWLWWRMLALHGGFLIASDTITVAPIPDEWRDCELCVQVRDGNVYQFAALGSVPGNGLMTDASRACRELAFGLKGEKAGQQLGVNLLRRLTEGNISNYGKVFNMPESGYCFYDWRNDPFSLWSKEGPDKPLPDSAVGLHWYGGHESTLRHEGSAHKDGDSWLERMAASA